MTYIWEQHPSHGHEIFKINNPSPDDLDSLGHAAWDLEGAH